MRTLRHDITDSLAPEAVEAIAVAAESEWGNYDMEDWGRYRLPYVGPMDDAPDGLLDQEFDGGYGAPCRPMWSAWSATRVSFGTEYDGATGYYSVPRNPPPMDDEAEVVDD